MRLDLDPRKTWMDDASPTSATSQDGGRNTRSPEPSPRKADSEGQDVGIYGVIDGAVGDVIDKYAAAAEDKGALSPPPQTPSPVPPFNSATVDDVRTLVERRMLIDPPLQPLNTAFDSLVNAHTQRPSTTTHSGTQTVFIDAPQSASSSATPTPTSADFRSMLESYTELPEDERTRLAEMADRIAEHCVKIAREEEKRKFLSAPVTPTIDSGLLSGNSGVTAATEPFTRSAASLNPSGLLTPTPTPGAALSPGMRNKGVEKIRTAGMKLRIMQHLLPAKVLLTQTAAAGELPSYAQTRAAAGYAYVALSHARLAFDVGEGGDGVGKGAAMQGRCAFYVGVSEWILAQHKKVEIPARSQPGTWTEYQDDEDARLSQGQAPVLGYFEMACRAKEGGYVEGVWAEEWMQYLRAHPDGVEKASERPSRTVLGWLTNILNPFRVTTSFRTDDGGGGVFGKSEDHDAGERLADLDEPDLEAGSPSGQGQQDEDHGYISPPPSQPRQQSSSSAELPRPVTSPTRHASNEAAISFNFIPSSSTARSIYERRGQSGDGAGRRRSLIARVTGREKMRSELQKAEEGEGPLSPREGIKRRKGEEEDEPVEVANRLGKIRLNHQPPPYRARP